MSTLKENGSKFASNDAFNVEIFKMFVCFIHLY